MVFAANSFAALTLNDDITWDVIGLDHNNLPTGPDKFPVGVRVCNTGASTETNVTATFVWDSNSFDWNTTLNIKGAASPANYINLSSSNTYTIDELVAGDCHDFYFQVIITRDSNAYDTIREFHIEVISDQSSLQTTPIGNQLYVERLVSQARNDNINIVLDSDPTADPITVFVGDTVSFTGTATTATNGYEQIEAYFGFDPDIFSIIDIQTTYTAGLSPQDTLYADACGWVEDPSDIITPEYKQCSGVGKAGGDLSVIYTVKIIDAGTGFLGGLVYDFSGSSFHYNADFGNALEGLAYTTAYKSNLSITKTDNLTTTSAGESISYDIVVSNAGPSDAIDAAVSDTFPAELENITWTCSADANSNCDTTSGTGDINTTADIASGESVSYTVTADVIAYPTQDLSNTATVASPTGYYPEDDLTDNTATDTTDIPRADLGITKDDGSLTYTPGDTFTYTLTVNNNGPDSADGAIVSDIFPGGFDNVTWTCIAANGAACTNPDSGGVTTALNESIATLPNGGTVTYTVIGNFSLNPGDY